MKAMRRILMLMSLAGTAMVSTSFAQAPPSFGPPPPPTAAPEVDPASAGAALTLLAGGLIVLRGRKRE